MSTKLTYSQIADTIRAVPTEGLQAHYAIGAMSSILAEAISKMTKKDQEYFINQVEWLKGKTTEIKSGY